MKRKMNNIIIGVWALTILFACGTIAASAEEPLSDYQITLAVDDELMEDPATPADFINVETAEGIVTLNGAVDNILARKRAETLASTIRGVRGIINRIDVEAPFRQDVEIEEDVQDALRWDPVTEAWELSASVNDGVVNLQGTVDSYQEKELAAKVAQGVRGVEEVNNDIMVDYKSDRADSEIKEEIVDTLRWDARVDHALINVSVDDGRVELTGTVGSLAEKTRAYTDAWVGGVRSVDHDNLTVKWWARDDRLRTDKYVDTSDAEIEEAVKDAFLYDPRVNMFDIQVESQSGYVTLRGTVDNLKAKRTAAQDADNIVGVWSVENKIKVVPGTPSDRRIAENVRDALRRDPFVDRYQIDVSVVGGQAYLFGEVDSTFEKAQADDLAAAQAGVREVSNFLTVREKDVSIYDPYTDDWYVYNYDWYAPAGGDMPLKDDWEIEEDIRDEIIWSPYVESSEVDVEVNDGVAHLTGTVDTWNEREAATENALEGGAVAVDNDLAVHYGPEYYMP